MRYALGLEYEGTDFLGWQKQPQARTLQAAVEAALSFVADAPIEVSCAGRTDAGVHAQCQVIHFDSEAARTPRGWMLGVNSKLPPEIGARWCVPMAKSFHARYAARARRYRYRILNRPLRAALDRRSVAWERVPLDAAAMHRAAQVLVGEHDFEAFRSVHCQSPHARRDLQEIAVRRDGDEVTLEVQANAFLHHMVRNILGSLLLVGRGEKPEAWIAEVLAGRDRRLAGPTAPAAGLIFLGPKYPPHWRLPEEVCL